MSQAAVSPNLNIQDFEMLSKLGEGTYGSVIKMRHKETKEIVAIKHVKMDVGESDEGIPATTIREVSLLKSLNHRNVVRLYDIIIQDTNKLYLIFEYVELDLSKYMKLHGQLPTKDVGEMFKGLVYALAYLHERGIIHRDLKPQNILIGKNFFETRDLNLVKVADFGLARDIAYSADDCPLTHEVVTLWYRCPEILMGSRKYGQGVDSWALGCILAEMLTERPVFQGECEIDQLFKIFQILGTPQPCRKGQENRPTDWHGIEHLPDWKPNFPRWRSVTLVKYLKIDRAIPQIEKLLGGLVCLNPKNRLSAGTIVPLLDKLGFA